MTPTSSPQAEHPWPTGYLFQSPGAHLTYRVVGPCCRLFDREQLPWPCCRIQWRGKEPSWRRIGKRLVPDMAARKSPSYCVEIVGQGYHTQPFVTTLYTAQFDAATRNWWYTQSTYLAKVTEQALAQASAALAEQPPADDPSDADPQ